MRSSAGFFSVWVAGGVAGVEHAVRAAASVAVSQSVYIGTPCGGKGTDRRWAEGAVEGASPAQAGWTCAGAARV